MGDGSSLKNKVTLPGSWSSGQRFEALAGCLQKQCAQSGFVSVTRSTSHQEAFREMPLPGLQGLVKYMRSVGFVGLLEPVKVRNEGTITKTNARAGCSLRWQSED